MEFYNNALEFEKQEDWNNYFIHLTQSANALYLEGINRLEHDYMIEKDAKQTFDQELVTFYEKQEGSYSIYYLGYMYQYGIHYKQNIKKAIEYYKLSISKGNSFSMVALGNIYEYDKTYTNYEEARRLYNLSSAKGNHYGTYYLGSGYYSGTIFPKDNIKAFECYSIAASHGNTKAMASLGYMYYNGLGVKKDVNKSFEYYMTAYEKGEIGLANNIGHIYHYNFKDEDNAIKYYNNAIDNKNYMGKYNLAQLYLTSTKYKMPIETILELLEDASNNDVPDAYYSLGILYDNGTFVEKDIEKAFKYFEKGAKLNEMNSLFVLGCYYKNGLHVKKNHKKATYYLKKAIDLGDSRAMVELADIYEKTAKDSTDKFLIRALYIKSSKKGNSDAMFKLGHIYRFGKGVKIDEKKAILYYKRAAKKGNDKAINTLGFLYYHGIMVDQNQEKGIELFKSIADKNLSAILNLGSILMKKNIKESIKYYQMGAEKGCMMSIFKLIEIYSQGETKDYGKMLDYCEIAIEKGNHEVMCNLGQFYETGEMFQSYETAFELYQKCYDQGGIYGGYLMGRLYEIGKGVTQDLQKAIDYYTEASSKGIMEATIALAKVYEKEQNYKKAIGLYKMISLKGDIEATIRLGEMYEYGIGINVNLDLAVEYYLKAQDNDHLVKIYEYIFKNKKINTYLEEEFINLDIKKYKLSDQLLKIRSRLI